MKHINNSSTRSSLTAVNPEKDVQPNALDIRIDKVFQIHGNTFELTDETKVHRKTTELLANKEGFFLLVPGVYTIVFENEVLVGENEAGWVITRSTLIRNGLQITTGLYDSGYNGKMAAGLHVSCGIAKIQRGCRVAQYLCFDAEMVHKYDGDYGVDKAHDQKYNK